MPYITCSLPGSWHQFLDFLLVNCQSVTVKKFRSDLFLCLSSRIKNIFEFVIFNLRCHVDRKRWRATDLYVIRGCRRSKCPGTRQGRCATTTARLRWELRRSTSSTPFRKRGRRRRLRSEELRVPLPLCPKRHARNSNSSPLGKLSWNKHSN